MSENPGRGRQARNCITNVPKILDLKSSSEQIFFRKCSLGAPNKITIGYTNRLCGRRVIWPLAGLISIYEPFHHWSDSHATSYWFFVQHFILPSKSFYSKVRWCNVHIWFSFLNVPLYYSGNFSGRVKRFLGPLVCFSADFFLFTEALGLITVFDAILTVSIKDGCGLRTADCGPRTADWV